MKNKITYYHGTNKEFVKFNDEYMFFTKDPDYAETYTKKASFVKEEREEYMEGASIIPVYLKINNPLIVDAKGYLYRNIYYGKELGKKIYLECIKKGIDCFKEVEFTTERNSTYDVAFIAKKLGYDSAIIKNVKDLGAEKKGTQTTDVFIVFDGEQIEIAIK